MTVEKKFLRIKEVLMVTSLKRSTLLNLCNEGEFPSPVRLTKRCVGWDSTSVNDWCKSKMEQVL